MSLQSIHTQLIQLSFLMYPLLLPPSAGFRQWLSETLGEKRVAKVEISSRLVDSPATLVQGAYGMSPTMARYMRAQAVAFGEKDSTMTNNQQVSSALGWTTRPLKLCTCLVCRFVENTRMARHVVGKVPGISSWVVSSSEIATRAHPKFLSSEEKKSIWCLPKDESSGRQHSVCFMFVTWASVFKIL